VAAAQQELSEVTKAYQAHESVVTQLAAGVEEAWLRFSTEQQRLQAERQCLNVIKIQMKQLEEQQSAS